MKGSESEAVLKVNVKVSSSYYGTGNLHFCNERSCLNVRYRFTTNADENNSLASFNVEHHHSKAHQNESVRISVSHSVLPKGRSFSAFSALPSSQPSFSYSPNVGKFQPPKVPEQARIQKYSTGGWARSTTPWGYIRIQIILKQSLTKYLSK